MEDQAAYTASKCDQEIGREMRYGGMVTAPFVKELNEQFRTVLKLANVMGIFGAAHMWSHYLCIPKPISICLKQDVTTNSLTLWKIIYVEESGRCLKARVNDHSKGTWSNHKLYSLETNHPITNISYFSIIDKDAYHVVREVWEMIHIRKLNHP